MLAEVKHTLVGHIVLLCKAIMRSRNCTSLQRSRDYCGATYLWHVHHITSLFTSLGDSVPTMRLDYRGVVVSRSFGGDQVADIIDTPDTLEAPALFYTSMMPCISSIGGVSRLVSKSRLLPQTPRYAKLLPIFTRCPYTPEYGRVFANESSPLSPEPAVGLIGLRVRLSDRFL